MARSFLAPFGAVLTALVLGGSPIAQFVVRDPQSAPSQLRFQVADADAGFTGVYTYSNTEHSGGIAWIDYNNDYWPDLFLTNGFLQDNWLFRNNGDGTFTDVSSVVSKPTTALEIAGVCFADIDNDGDSDLFLPVDSPIPLGTVVGGPNLLYVNQGDGTFVESALTAGLVDPLGRRNIVANFVDMDRDGSVDLYLGRWARQVLPLDSFDRLLQNDGTGLFSDVTGGFDPFGRNALTSIVFDADFDGWPDLYVGNVGESSSGLSQPDNCDLFWLNDQTGFAFSDVTGGCSVIGNDATASMGLAVGDIDNDGDWDLYITDNAVDGDAPLGNVLYLGDGAGGFVDNNCDIAGVCTSVGAWPCSFSDFDNDGLLDLWVGTLKAGNPDYVFHNRGDGTFLAVPSAAHLGHAARGGATADYDGDGDVDFAVWNSNSNSNLIRNDTDLPHNWVSIRVFGTTSNHDAIGAIVRVTAGGVTQMRQVSGGDSAHSQRELILHFGLGKATSIDTVQVTWPSGTVKTFQGVEMNQLHFMDETIGIVPEVLNATTATWSTSSQVLFVEVEGNYGGRTGFDCTGFGPLVWNPESLTFSGTFTGVSTSPVTIDVVSVGGASFSLPVVTLP